jgi:hypothetical protein
MYTRELPKITQKRNPNVDMYNGAGAAFTAAPGANDDACDWGWGADEEEKEVLLIERDGDGDGDEALPEPVPNPPVEPRPPPLVGADEPPPTADGGAASAEAIPICSCVPSVLRDHQEQMRCSFFRPPK